MKLIHNVHYVNSAGVSTYSLKGSFGEPAAGSTSPSASTRPREFVLGGTLGRRLLILGLRFGALEVHFDVFFVALGPDPGLLFRLFPKSLEKSAKKKVKKGAEMEAFPVIFKVFPESAFRLRRRERIEVQAPDFLALCLHFCSPIFASFF